MTLQSFIQNDYIYQTANDNMQGAPVAMPASLSDYMHPGRYQSELWPEHDTLFTPNYTSSLSLHGYSTFGFINFGFDGSLLPSIPSDLATDLAPVSLELVNDMQGNHDEANIVPSATRTSPNPTQGLTAQTCRRERTRRLIPAHPGCESSTVKKNALGSKLHQCGHCGRAFARRHDLDRHTHVHTGAKPYVCPCCFKSFARSDARGRHFRNDPTCQQGPRILNAVKMKFQRMM